MFGPPLLPPDADYSIWANPNAQPQTQLRHTQQQPQNDKSDAAAAAAAALAAAATANPASDNSPWGSGAWGSKPAAITAAAAPQQNNYNAWALKRPALGGTDGSPLGGVAVAPGGAASLLAPGPPGSNRSGGSCGASAGVSPVIAPAMIPATGPTPLPLGGNAGTSSVVRCKGVPFSASSADVDAFFEPLPVVGVHFLVGADSLPSGDCLVRFASAAPVADALARSRRVLSHRYVRVEVASNAEYDELTAPSAPPPAAAAAAAKASPAKSSPPTAAPSAAAAARKTSTSPAAAAATAAAAAAAKSANPGDTGSVVVKMRGLPYSAQEEQIADFFSGLRIASGGVSLGRDSNGRPSGEAHVEFASEGDASAAMALNRQRMGNRYIELFRTKQLPNARRSSAASGGAAEGAGNGSDSLRMRGMPFHSTEADVSTFFRGYNIASGGIKLGPQGGHGLVRFASSDEARKALAALNHSYMGSRYIELFWAS